MNKLHTETIPGNLHQAAVWINKRGWAEYLFSLEYTPGSPSSTGVFKMPARLVHEIRRANPCYVADPHHDDYKFEEEKDDE